MTAVDNGPIPRRGSALVFVTITRNLVPPVWTNNSPRSGSVREDADAGTSIIQVTAQDGDSQVSCISC